MHLLYFDSLYYTTNMINVRESINAWDFKQINVI